MTTSGSALTQSHPSERSAPSRTDVAPLLSRLRSEPESPAVPWLRALFRHVRQARLDHPQDELLVVLDVDGTLLDFRSGLVDLFERFDQEHQSQHFAGLEREELSLDEAVLRRLFESRGVPHHLRRELLARVERLGWSPKAVIGAHQPFLGMLEVLRWFKAQPQVHVAFNTERSEERREETLQALSTLGAAYGLRFPEDLLYTGAPFRSHAPSAEARAGFTHATGASGEGASSNHDPGAETPLPETVLVDQADLARARAEHRMRNKLAGIRHFQERGFLVVAVVDDRPQVLEALRNQLDQPHLMFLQARGLAASLPSLSDQLGVAEVPQVAWRGLQTLADLGHFLGSPLEWAELPIERSAAGELIVARRRGTGRPLVLEEILGSFAQCSKGLRLQLLEGGSLLTRTCLALRQSGFPAERVQFCLPPDAAGRAGYQRLLEEFPQSTRIAPIGFLSVVAAIAVTQAREVLLQLADWGVERVSIPLNDPHRVLLEALGRETGFEIEIDAGDDLGDYLQAVSGSPRSVVSEFGCETWRLRP